MSIFEFIALVLIPGGVAGALAGGIVHFFVNKKLDMHTRTMETRKNIYTRINKLFVAFFSTASDAESEKAIDGILECLREIQIWGSDEVVERFQKVLFDTIPENNIPKENRDLSYKEFVLAMRRDILGKTRILAPQISIHGHIKKK
ncbi:MAG: hypothetical protein HYV77_01355 [Candidatus Wildermuthbacteria bacterium]|nr:hypothetical protein [Candidatus Wildermuthbacteria bacterium]